jgi:hypothetical protein
MLMAQIVRDQADETGIRSANIRPSSVHCGQEFKLYIVNILTREICRSFTYEKGEGVRSSRESSADGPVHLLVS